MGRGSSGKRNFASSKARSISYLGKTIDISGNDELGIPKNVMSQEDFLSKYGVKSPVSSYSVDKYGGANRTRLSQRQREATDKKVLEEQGKYFEKRQKVIVKYNELILNGTVKRPTLLQESLRKSQGHSDNASVRAARRIVDKLGYNWKTGKKRKPHQ